MAERSDIQATLGRIQPLPGRVLPIKTVQETQPREEFGDAYAAEVNIKSASKVIQALDSNLPRHPSLSLNHLRRFARRDALPEHLRAVLQSDPTPHTIFVLISPPLADVETLLHLLAPFAPLRANDSENTPQIQSPDPSTIHLYPLRIPLLPPLNYRQAETWTKTLWPVVFNPSAPRATVAPPPQIVNRVQESIRSTAGHYLALAETVAEEAERFGRGRRVGAVVVDPAIRERIIATGAANEDQRWLDAVVAVAGDARYSRREGGNPSQSERHSSAGPNPASQTYNIDLEGGPELHALMRAVDLVASKRRENAGEPPSSTDADPQDLSPLENYFLSLSDTEPPSCPDTQSQSPENGDPHPEPEDENPDTDAAPQISRIRPRTQGGYLCIDLDVYVSREPCLCCSMGMLLSRFRAVVFPLKGRLRTGGLASEPSFVVAPPVPASTSTAEEGNDGSGVGETQKDDTGEREKYYGLHWRKELNWRALGFEFVEEGASVESEAVVFHA